MEANASVDELTHEVGMPGVTTRLGDHVDQEPVEGGAGAVRPPPRDGHRRIEREVVNGDVTMLIRPPVETEDRLTRLVRRRPQIRVGTSAVLEPGQRFREASTEWFAEVAELHSRQVLDQAQEVR